MPIDTPADGPALLRLLSDYSLEMTGKDVPALEEAAPVIPPGTRINVTFLANEDLAMRVAAARAVRAHGFVPVPHLSARRLRSQRELEEFLAALAEVGAAEHVFVVGGDPETPEGPYEDSLSVVRTGLLQQHGVRGVSVSGYPEGHPGIDDDALWSALTGKVAAIRAQGLEPTVITQFGFDTDPVLEWLAEVRRRGVDAPVRIGVPGPAGIKRLLGYARRFGVSTSAGIVQKYGFSLTNLLGTAGPDRFLHDLAAGHDPSVHGQVQLHFYTFGGLRATAEWVRGFAPTGQGTR
ncbi:MULTISPECIES: methylenetetrahydrofolate reductase [Kocuria]|jgi:methylenetetrahydrofolate reductase (NADPH)|uniref:methylenetetrahydrofolate reductase n=1 Tax=Kocuria TaxID=57493 RepID=UPI0020413E1D|nr:MULTISPECIES: methylenetetrahydrofolate reductase [Kocuria]MCM3687024.1 methylenetetrahydrofolate reductase [Kocuria rosea]